MIPVRPDSPILSLFSGVAGLELGLEAAGLGKPVGFYEHWTPAQEVLSRRFPDVPIHGDIDGLAHFHGATMVTAGFPCTDLSQAGRTRGLDGLASGLVRRVLQVLKSSRPEWVLIENVPNMLRLGRGNAMTEITETLQEAGYNWAYRVIDSRSFGLPQRRRRVYLLASASADPATVLFRSDVPSARADGAAVGAWRDAFGFYWTEGNRGLGWAVDAVPTLKGSTTVSIPSPPAVWLPRAAPGRRVVRLSITAAERLQGLPAGWTDPAPARDRWKLVGNAVSVPAATWIGAGLLSPPPPSSVDALDRSPRPTDAPWPIAAHRIEGKTWHVHVSEWPLPPVGPERHLSTVLRKHGCEPLSHRATRGFRDRLLRSSLGYPEAFMRDLDDHVASTVR